MKDEQGYSSEKVIVEKIVSHGFGLAYGANKKILMIKKALVGEEVLVQYKNTKKDFEFAFIQEILTPSIDRIQALCPLFDVCGGCQFQMMPYHLQLKTKHLMIQDSLTHIGKLSEIQVWVPIGSPKEFYYRNKASFQVFKKDKVGFCKPGSQIPFEVKQCFLMESSIQNTLDDIRESDALLKKKMKSLLIRSNYEGKTISSLISKDSFCEKVENLLFYVDINTFFQVNRSVLGDWLGYMKKQIQLLGLHRGLLDLYCGVGLISQFLAPLFKKVIGIEINKTLVENGKKLLKANGLNHVDLFCDDAAVFETMDFDYDCMIINPPRQGLNKDFMQSLIKMKPPAVLYSSCNADTFARDTAILVKNGYHIQEVQPFDMFPQTAHVELVGFLTLT